MVMMTEAQQGCDHKFVDSKICLRCGVPFETLQRKSRLALGKSELRSFAENFRDAVFSFLRRELGEKGSNPESWTAMRLRSAATDLARMVRDTVHVEVVPDIRTVTLTIRTPFGHEVTPFEDFESIDVVIIAKDAHEGNDRYAKLTLIEGGLAIVESCVLLREAYDV